MTIGQDISRYLCEINFLYQAYRNCKLFGKNAVIYELFNSLCTIVYNIDATC